jgi:nucleolin
MKDEQDPKPIAKKEEEEGEDLNPIVKKDEEEGEGEDGGKSRRKRKRKRKKKEGEDEDQEEEVVDEKVKQTAEIDRTVFVEGIPFACKDEDVRSFFKSNGLTLADCRLPVWQDTGRLKGYGHIVLATVEEQQKALALDGKYLKDRYLSIRLANAPKEAIHGKDSQQAPSKTIMLQNLSYEATEDDIEKAVEKFGSIADGGIRIARHNATKRSRGFGYIEFDSIESAKKVAAAANVAVLGRPCRVDFDHGRIASSFRTSTGRRCEKTYGSSNDKKQRSKKSR